MHFHTILALVLLLAFLNPIFAQECDTEKKVEEKKELASDANDALTKATKALENFKKKPLPPKPTGNKPTGNKASAKEAFDASNDIWLKAKEISAEANNKLKQGEATPSL